MAFLERNLEQLTVVQRQLVEQNSSLKKEVAIAERKLIARNERIQSLESLLQDSQEKLTAANHRYVQFVPISDPASCKAQETDNGISTQLRSPTHSRQGASRGRALRLHERATWLGHFVRIRRRGFENSETVKRWWRRVAFAAATDNLQSAEPGDWRWWRREAEFMVLQSENVKLDLSNSLFFDVPHS